MRSSFLIAALLFAGGTVLADPIAPVAGDTKKPDGADAKAAAGPASSPSKAEPPKDKPKESVTQHSVTINGAKVDYTVKAGLIPLKDPEGKPTAEIFYVAYTKDGAGDLTKRPLTFSFNGGPGSSSVWMHMGLLGPRRVKLKDDGGALPPPYTLVDNEYSLLDETDLVFIDPVGTGYSRASKPDEAKKFFGVKEDAQSVAEFIRLYVTKNTRWSSPKFLIGESYGTTRAAYLSGLLANKHRMNLNGIMLVSTVLNFQTIWGGEGNDLPHALYLPSYTATAWHHRKLPQDLQSKPLPEVLKEAEAFAAGPYSHALFMGTGLAGDERKNVLTQLARFTGLTPDYLDRADLRPGLHRFNVELLRDQNLELGRFDSRYTGPVRNRLSEHTENDPSGDAIFGAFASTLNDYLRRDLKFEEDKPYEILTSLGAWNWDSDNDFLNVAEALAEAMTQNPFLKVHVSSGYTDMATPYFATKYTFNHLNIAPSLRGNLVLDEYSSGHMMYLNLADLKKQKADLAKFVRMASGQ